MEWSEYRVSREEMSAVGLTSLISRACSMTSVKPLSCREESRDGSWNTNTVTTSVAVEGGGREGKRDKYV